MLICCKKKVFEGKEYRSDPKLPVLRMLRNLDVHAPDNEVDVSHL